jgi:hypothetical protein
MLSQPRIPGVLPSSASYSNTRYHQLKHSMSYPSRRPAHRSADVSIRSRPSKTKSVSDLQQLSQFSSTNLPKAHSWHMMANNQKSNLSVAYAQEINLAPKRHRKHSSRKRKKSIQPPRRLPSPPKRQPSFRAQRRSTVKIPECGVIRISTLDEMPIANQQKSQRSNSINNDRSSTKGSVSNSCKHRKGNRKKDEVQVDSDAQSSSSSSSSHSHSSLQQRLNGSLRNDPLITAAMENFRQFRRTFSQTKLSNPRSRNLSRDSLCSDSTFHSSPPSSRRSRNDSQSSFTSIERSEIRQLIKTVKSKRPKPLTIPDQVSTPPSVHSLTTTSHSPAPIKKSRKSSLTEELDREFGKLRELDPDQELDCVAPSTISKRKKPIEKPPVATIPPIPTFDELLRKVQLRPIDKTIKTISLQEKPIDDIYENPLSCIPVSVSVPVPVPQCSPIPLDEIKTDESKHEYAIPIKKSEERSFPQISHFQPTRNLKFPKPIMNINSEKQSPRPVSMFSWFQNTSTNPLPTTFQPNRIINNRSENGSTSVKENIYTEDIDVYVPSSAIEKSGENILQIHLDNENILTDEYYSDYQTKQIPNSSSILNEFSQLFARKHKQHHQNKLYKKEHRCSIM